MLATLLYTLAIGAVLILGTIVYVVGCVMRSRNDLPSDAD